MKVKVEIISDASMNLEGDLLTKGSVKEVDVDDYILGFLKTNAEAGHIALEIEGKAYEVSKEAPKETPVAPAKEEPAKNAEETKETPAETTEDTEAPKKTGAKK